MVFRAPLPAIATWSAKVLGLAVVNCLAGRLGLLLAIPPGFATAVFPPSGIALAAILLWGYSIWPGVFLGSFCFNVYVALSAGDAGTFPPLLTAASLALGSSLQAVLGAYLIRRFVGFPTALARGSQVARFLGLGGPVSCVVAATWGVGTLWWAETIPWESFAYSWFTWWVGDTIGVLIFTPLLMVALAQPRHIWRPRGLRLAVPLGITFAAVIVVFLYASSRERANVTLQFQRRADALNRALQDRFEGYVDVLHSLGSFYDSSIAVERHEFHTFVRRSFARYAGIQALEWVPHVAGAERQAHEAAARQDALRIQDTAVRQALADYEIRERDESPRPPSLVRAAQREQYFPVCFVEPLAGNEAALGFDLASDATRLEALLRSRDSGQPVGTARIDLIQETGHTHGVLLYLPIYRRGMPIETIDQRRQHLQGFVVGVFRIGEIVQATRADVQWPGIELRILDTSAPPGEQLLYRSVGDQADSPAPRLPPAGPLGLQMTTPYEVAGRTWSFEFTPTLTFLELHRGWSSWSWFVLAGGMLFTSLLGGFLLVVTGHTAESERLVDQRTAQLQAANRSLDRQAQELARSNLDLEQFAYVASHDLQEPLRGVVGFCQLLQRKYQGQLDDTADEYLTDIVRGATRMQQLIDDLLQFSRVSRADKLLTPTDCGAVLDQVCATLQASIDESQATIRCDGLPCVQADGAQLAQLFQNLISNAIKYRGTDPPEIRIAARPQNGRWLFSVSDNGIGIDPQYQERVFQIFKRLHTRDAYPGTGIGLAICQRIVQRHGGEIWVESNRGQGSVFRFTIPGATNGPHLAADRGE